MILCWAAFLAILGCMQPVDCGLDNPEFLDKRETTFYRERSCSGSQLVQFYANKVSKLQV